MTKFIKQLEKIRKEKGLSKHKIAKISGIANSQLHNYYRGTNPTDETIKKIAIGLEVDPIYFNDYKINRAIKILEKNPELLNEVLLKANYSNISTLEKEAVLLGETIIKHYYQNPQAQDYILCQLRKTETKSAQKRIIPRKAA